MTTNTNAASSIMELIDAYAESRHVNGAPHYNARTAEARAAVAAALASPGAVAAPAPTACAECNGAGEVFGHADDCTDDLCALNGDIYSCAGKVEPCQCMDSVAPIREAEGAVAAEPTGWQPLPPAPKE